MDDELLDLVDKDDNVIGTVLKSVSQGDPSRMYRAIAIAVFNDKKEVLLQKRSLNKTYDPGVWRISASGHVNANEDPKLAATRELFEELGIRVNPIFYKKTLLEVSGKNDIKLPRIFYVYYALENSSHKLNLNKTEVEEAIWISVEELINFSQHNQYDLEDFTHKNIVEIYNNRIKK